ncbi:Helitron helicase-like protein [Phytophthora palmivora]|uniref:Helitron helicase-like protein n=1 Tax=Phytophthora palmivora TaxID=4796 RepID=A0A2P4XH20_9STRA|nr:Helitron helicase-like protein [Phytophthora palmivora]
MSLREFVAYPLYDRTGSHSLLLLGGRLTQLYCVDQWAKAEQERLRMRVILRQTGIVSEENVSLDANTIGRRLILPPSFTGGPRYMYQRFQDAMAIVRELGAHNIFITMMCNPKWVEIQENIRPGQTASDRPDVRGLPHAHILLITRPEDKLLTAEDVDRLVLAEIPDKEKQPQLYGTVVTCMLHGPCGDANKNSLCMKNGKCSKTFPKPLAEETTMAVDKYHWVVPDNPFLSQKYNCHINVEICATSKAVKYIYKYAYKGADMTMVTIEGGIQDHSLNEFCSIC